MIEGSCHCGRVRFAVGAELVEGERLPLDGGGPRQVTQCNCSICSKLGQLVSYCPPGDFSVTEGEDALSSYSWGDRLMDFRFCGTCACMVYSRVKPELIAEVWPDAGARKVMVNARLLEGVDLGAVAVREVDGRG